MDPHIFVGEELTVKECILNLSIQELYSAKRSAIAIKLFNYFPTLPVENGSDNKNTKYLKSTHRSGYAAGQPYRHVTYITRYGGPANTLCLPKDPELSNISFTGGWSYLFGAEYEANEFAPDSTDNDVPCAVCRNTNASSSIMIPGRQSCYTGWMKEYNGRLASGHEGEAASSYTCVDNNPEYIPSGEKNENGHLFYLVGFKCGPLPCPPYHDNHQVNCVVCSK
ncbi:unnamed protein product [Mytilus edulis]|uniref:Short-chain collagen C4-like n=1 Tax=Mytilus edulis TaxID=6550 RepID=A0A8S3R239_MYTED|nr:unnamed protein product [Mytilus edulis]